MKLKKKRGVPLHPRFIRLFVDAYLATGSAGQAYLSIVQHISNLKLTDEDDAMKQGRSWLASDEVKLEMYSRNLPVEFIMKNRDDNLKLLIILRNDMYDLYNKAKTEGNIPDMIKYGRQLEQKVEMFARLTTTVPASTTINNYTQINAKEVHVENQSEKIAETLLLYKKYASNQNVVDIKPDESTPQEGI